MHKVTWAKALVLLSEDREFARASALLELVNTPVCFGSLKKLLGEFKILFVIEKNAEICCAYDFVLNWMPLVTEPSDSAEQWS